MRPRLGLALLLSAIGGCGGSNLPQNMGPTAEMATADAAMALCTKINMCVPLLISTQYTDVAACQTRFAISIKASLAAPMTGQTPTTLDACAMALGAISCDDLFAGKTPDPCKPVKGMIADGTACGDDGQCKSTFCAKQRGNVCGTCGPRPMAGSDCTNVDCGNQGGLTCANKTCVVSGSLGAACDGSHPCIASLGCKGATPVPPVMGTCVMPITTAGTTCDPQAIQTAPCDGSKGLFCNPFANNTCDMIQLAATGEACGVVNKKLVVCKASGHCTKPFPQMGTCTAAAADGAACDDTNGPTCTPPAHCVASVCKIDDPASCK